MKKKAKFTLTLYQVGAVAFAYVLLIGIALVHYYYHYALLQSGMVLLLLVKLFFLPIFILSTVILNKRVNKGPFEWSKLLSLWGGKRRRSFRAAW